MVETSHQAETKKIKEGLLETTREESAESGTPSRRRVEPASYTTMKTSLALLAAGIIGASVYVVDHAFPRIGSWEFLYVAVVLIAARSRKTWMPFLAATLCSGVLALDHLVLWLAPRSEPVLEMENQGLAFLAVWATALFSARIATRREQLRSLSEDLEQRVSERTRTLDLLLDVSVEVNLADTLEQGIHGVLERVAKFNGWCYGHAFLADPDFPEELAPASIFYETESDRFASYRERLSNRRIRKGEEIVGRVFQSGQPDWTPIRAQGLSADEAVVPEDLSVLAAVAFPILSGEETVGVLEFFSEEELHLEQPTFEAMARIGIDLGRLSEGERAHNEIRESEKWFRSIFDDAPIAIAIGDRDGRLLLGNSAFTDFMELSTEEFHGRRLADFVHPSDTWKIIHIYDRCIQGENPDRPVDIRIQRSNGFVRWGVLSLSSIASINGGGVFGIVMIQDIHDRKKLEKSIARLSIREQQRIGQELHDGLGQQLVGMSMLAKSLHQSLAKKDASEAKTASQLVESFQDAENLMRRLARGLNPVLPQSEGFMNAIEEMVENASCLSGIPIDFEYNQRLSLEDNQVATHLFYIAQEAINNAIKYSQADRVRVVLSVQEDSLNLAIADNGIGIDNSDSDHEGLGMRNMHFRAGVLGGNLTIETPQGGGTVVNLYLSREHWHEKEDGA